MKNKNVNEKYKKFFPIWYIALDRKENALYLIFF